LPGLPGHLFGFIAFASCPIDEPKNYSKSVSFSRSGITTKGISHV
jgi:hypothetical protein